MITSVSSLMDANVRLNWENWGVTLTCDKGQSFHARLVFEGFKSQDLSSHFYQIAHLRGLPGFNPFGKHGCSFGKNGVGVVELSKRKDGTSFKV